MNGFEIFLETHKKLHYFVIKYKEKKYSLFSGYHEKPIPKILIKIAKAANTEVITFSESLELSNKFDLIGERLQKASLMQTLLCPT